VPANLYVHLVMDNYVTYKTNLVRDWLAKRPRWHVHFTPTGASWINQVERFFADLTEKQIPAPSSTPTTPTQSPFAGPSLPTTSSPPSSASASEPNRSEELRIRTLEWKESGGPRQRSPIASAP
jgi:hypothetical protein